MKNITAKKIILGYIFIIIFQFALLAFSSNVNSVGYEVKKAREVAIKQNPKLYNQLSNSYNEKLEEEFITKIAEQTYVEKLNRIQMDCGLRKNMGEDQKSVNELVQFFKDTINEIKAVRPDS
jgi:hypothetical protein